MLGPGGVHLRNTVWSSALSSIQSKRHWQVFPQTGASKSSEEKLTWAGWRICTGSAQWWGRTPRPPRPWRRGFVPPSPTRVARRSGSPLVDTMQGPSQKRSTRDHGPSSSSPLFLEHRWVSPMTRRKYTREWPLSKPDLVEVWGKHAAIQYRSEFQSKMYIRSVASSKICNEMPKSFVKRQQSRVIFTVSILTDYKFPKERL